MPKEIYITVTKYMFYKTTDMSGTTFSATFTCLSIAAYDTFTCYSQLNTTTKVSYLLLIALPHPWVREELYQCHYLK